jgi:hypothetical protein
MIAFSKVKWSSLLWQNQVLKVVLSKLLNPQTRNLKAKNLPEEDTSFRKTMIQNL